MKTDYLAKALASEILERNYLNVDDIPNIINFRIRDILYLLSEENSNKAKNEYFELRKDYYKHLGKSSQIKYGFKMQKAKEKVKIHNLISDQIRKDNEYFKLKRYLRNNDMGHILDNFFDSL